MKVDINRKPEQYLSEQVLSCIETDMSFHITFPNKKEYVSTIRDALRHIFDYHGLSVIWSQRMTLVADEIMTNAIMYGSIDGDVNEFRLDLISKPDALYVAYEVQDTGHHLDSRTAAQMEELIEINSKTWTEDFARRRGRGYQMISKICDDFSFVDVENGGLIVRAEKMVPLMGSE